MEIIMIGTKVGVFPFRRPIKPTYVILDQLTTADAAPIATPRTCEPGPGTITFTDTNSIMGIASGNLVISGTSVAGDGWKSSASVVRNCGLGLFGRLVATGGSAGAIGASNVNFGFSSTNAINGTAAADARPWQVSGGFADMIVSTGATVRRIFPFGAYTGDYGVILRSIAGGGAWYVTRANGEDWKLAHITRRLTTSPLWPRMHLGASTGLNMNWDDIAVVQLNSPWNTDWGLVTTRTANAAANDTITHTADGHVEATRTIATNDVWDIMFRWTDDNNCWILRVDQSQTGTTSALRLYERVSGVESLRQTGSGTITLTNGQSQRVLISFESTNIQCFISSVGGSDTERINYTTATNNKSATTAKTNLACTDFTSWPKLLSGAALGVLSFNYPFGTGALAEVYADGTIAADSSTYNPATRLTTGGSARGYKTLAAAISAAKVGGTVWVRGGTFSERNSADCCFNLTKKVSLKRYDPAEVPTLTYPAGSPPLISAGEFGHIVKVIADACTLDGIKVIGTLAEGDSVSLDYDINVYVTGNDCTVRNCDLISFGHAGIKTKSGISGYIFEQNRIHNGGFTGRDHGVYDVVGGGIIRHNALYVCSGYGLQLYDFPVATTVYGNAIFGNVTGGVVLSGNGAHHFDNNTLTSNGTQGGVFFFNYTGALASFSNNIIQGNSYGVGNNQGDISMDNPVGIVQGSHNCIGFIHAARLAYYSGSGDLALGTDPLIVDNTPETFDDLRLQGTSPCIGAGILLSGITLLDSASTAVPASKAGSNSTTIGAFIP